MKIKLAVSTPLSQDAKKAVARAKNYHGPQPRTEMLFNHLIRYRDGTATIIEQQEPMLVSYGGDRHYYLRPGVQDTAFTNATQYTAKELKRVIAARRKTVFPSAIRPRVYVSQLVIVSGGVVQSMYPSASLSMLGATVSNILIYPSASGDKLVPVWGNYGWLIEVAYSAISVDELSLDPYTSGGRIYTRRVPKSLSSTTFSISGVAVPWVCKEVDREWVVVELPGPEPDSLTPITFSVSATLDGDDYAVSIACTYWLAEPNEVVGTGTTTSAGISVTGSTHAYKTVISADGAFWQIGRVLMGEDGVLRMSDWFVWGARGAVDLGAHTTLYATNINGNDVLVREYTCVSSFPLLADWANTTVTYGEITVAWDMTVNAKCTVRGGGYAVPTVAVAPSAVPQDTMGWGLFGLWQNGSSQLPELEPANMLPFYDPYLSANGVDAGISSVQSNTDASQMFVGHRRGPWMWSLWGAVERGQFSDTLVADLKAAATARANEPVSVSTADGPIVLDYLVFWRDEALLFLSRVDAFVTQYKQLVAEGASTTQLFIDELSTHYFWVLSNTMGLSIEKALRVPTGSFILI